MPALSEQVLLVVDRRINPFVPALQDALEVAGADVLVASDEVGALASLRRFDVSAILIGDLAGASDQARRLQRELGGVPVLRYGDEEGVAEIVEAVTALLTRARSR